MLRVTLQPGLPGGRWACLRELCGRDETDLAGEEDLVAVELLDRLLVERPGTTVGPGSAAALAISDRDRLLAAVYARHFADRIEGSQRCASCGAPFEVSFSLAALLESLEPELACDDDGAFRLPDGRRFRLPTTLDHRRCIGLAPEAAALELLRGCLLDGAPADAGDAEVIEAAMERAGPMLDLDVDASCPSCAHAQVVRFDIVRHLAGVMASERRWLVREIHCLAKAYGWSLGEILSLPRRERRAFVKLNEPSSLPEGWS